MPDQLQLRGGTTTEHNSFTGAAREVTVDTTKKTLVVHDGSQAGGTPLMKESGATAASSVQIGTGGVERFKITATEVVFNETSTNTDFRIEGNGDANLFKVDAGNDRIGIGTGSPTAPFHIVGSDNNTILLVESTDADAGVGPIIELFRNSASPADNDNIGRIDFKADDDNGNPNTFARIAAVATDVSNGSEDGRIDFIAASNDTFNTAMSVAGLNVGIGTTSPTGKLSIASGTFQTTTPTSTGDDIVISGNQSLGIQFLTLASGTSNNNIYFGDTDDPDIGMIRYAHADNSLQFRTNTSERMRITSGGVLAIGATTPIASATNLYVENSGENNVYFVGNTSTSGARLILQNKNTTANSFTGILGADGGGQTTSAIKFYSADNDNNEGYLALETRPSGGIPTERMRIMSDGKVGIGTTSPTANGLHIHRSSGDPQILVSGSGHAAITLTSTSNSDHTGVNFGDSLDNNAGMIQYTNSSDIMQIHTAGGEKTRIHNTGEISIATTSKNLQGGGASDFYLSIQANTGSNHNGVIVGGVASGHGAFTTRPSGDHTYFAGFFLNSSASGVGNISVGSSGTSFNTSSDYRLKENVVSLSDGITRLKQLLPKRFNWISDETNTLQDGFLAHEVSSLVPEAVTGEKDAVATEDGGQHSKGDPIYQTIDHSKLVPLLVAAVKELIGKVEVLEAA